MDPPAYLETANETESWDAPPGEEPPHELPDYTDLNVDVDALPRSRRATAHVYNVYGNRGVKQWFMLHVKSRARAPESLPYFLQGDPIAGSVDLDLPQETTIRSVSVHVRCVPCALSVDVSWVSL